MTSIFYESSMMRKNIIKIFPLFILIGFGFIIYANSFDTPFMFDDIPRIEDNPQIHVRELNFKNLVNAAFSEKAARSRPVGNISFALNYYFHQSDLKIYHITNVIIHIITGILLYYFLLTTLGRSEIWRKKGRMEGCFDFQAHSYGLPGS